MMASMDSAGRVVIPKDVRDRLHLDEDTEFEVDVVGDAIQLTPRRRPGRVVVEIDGWPVLAAVEGHVVTDTDVQDARRASRR